MENVHTFHATFFLLIVMSKLPRLSGKEVVKLLTNKFYFEIENWRGSHCTLVNRNVRPPIRLIVPASHQEIRQGTLTGIVSKSRVGREAFLKAANS